MQIVYENSFENITQEKDPNLSTSMAEHKIQTNQDLTTHTVKSETEIVTASYESNNQVYFYQGIRMIYTSI